MRTKPRNVVNTSQREWRRIVTALLAALAVIVTVVTMLVLSALNDVAQNTNKLDEERSRETITGALETFQAQLGATLNDYAAWDDAAQFVYAANGHDWVVSNYGDMTVNSELFDTALVIDENDRVQMFYQFGQPVLRSPQELFPTGLTELLKTVRQIPFGQNPEATGFVQSDRGITVIGAALIRPKMALDVPAGETRRYLVFARHLDTAKIKRLSKTYVVDGLQLRKANFDARYFVNIFSPQGEVLGKLTWRSRAPGDVSFREVRPTVLLAVVIAGLFFLTLFFVGSKIIGRIKTDEAHAKEEALRDRLSGLYNRAGLFQRLEQMVAKARLGSDEVNLLYLDLDGFKEVNDSYGHGTGDRLIKGVAAGLKMLVPQDAVLARLGGDEFAVAINGPYSKQQCLDLCEACLLLFSEPFVIGERVATIGCSIGVATSERGEVDGEELLRRADMAMYEAKENGRGRWVSYHAQLDTEREDRNMLEADLRRAIEKDELTVVFQPVVSAKSRRITGVEALVRWNRDGHGPVSPEVFIPVAETSGLIDQLGLIVLRKACMTARRWPEIKLSVNISPVQFRNPSFSTSVHDVLRQTQMEPERLRLEMTEGYFIQHPERASFVIEKLKALGVQIALDDFGAGFASVGYLRRFGFNRMKIDRSLVAALENGGRSLDMLEATVALARSLEIPVTAEGVESVEQASILQLCGCDELQGYLFSKPVSPEEVTLLLERQKATLPRDEQRAFG